MLQVIIPTKSRIILINLEQNYTRADSERAISKYTDSITLC